LNAVAPKLKVRRRACHVIETVGDNLHCSPLDRPYKARILAHYPESAHGTQFDADAVCMVSCHRVNAILFVHDISIQ